MQLHFFYFFYFFALICLHEVMCKHRVCSRWSGCLLYSNVFTLLFGTELCSRISHAGLWRVVIHTQHCLLIFNIWFSLHGVNISSCIYWSVARGLWFFRGRVQRVVKHHIVVPSPRPVSSARLLLLSRVNVVFFFFHDAQST